MRKRNTRRKVIPKYPPAMLVLRDVCLAERMALGAFISGEPTPANHTMLLDCAEMLLLAASKKEPDISRIASLARDELAMLAVAYRHRGDLRAKGDTLRLFGLLVEISEDFWNRQSGGLYAATYDALSRHRQARLANVRKTTTTETST